MSVTDGFREFALEQLGRLAPGVRARSMFGGIGIYAGDRFFALLDDDLLYLKADARTLPEFEAAGLRPFRPFGEDTTPMRYYAVPAEWLEDVDLLFPWVERALAAAARKGRPGPRSR